MDELSSGGHNQEYTGHLCRFLKSLYSSELKPNSILQINTKYFCTILILHFAGIQLLNDQETIAVNFIPNFTKSCSSFQENIMHFVAAQLVVFELPIKHAYIIIYLQQPQLRGLWV
jgi:hypothetical protein